MILSLYSTTIMCLLINLFRLRKATENKRNIFLKQILPVFVVQNLIILTLVITKHTEFNTVEAIVGAVVINLLLLCPLPFFMYD